MQSVLQNTIVDLQLAGYSPGTVEAYSYHVKKFLEYFDKNPADICEDEIKQYFLYLKYKKELLGSAPINTGFPLTLQQAPGLRKMLFMDEKPRNDTLPTVTVKTLLCPVCGTQLVWVRTLHRGADYDP